MTDIDTEIEQAHQELAKLRAQGALKLQRQILERDVVYQGIREVEKRLKAGIEEELPKQTPLYVYTKCIKTARAQDVAPYYATYLEAQVCRAVHHVVVFKKQLAMVKMTCDWMVNLMQGAVSSIENEKSQVEMHGMNNISALDGSRASMEEKYAMELHEQKEAKRTMLEKKGVKPSMQDKIVEHSEDPSMTSMAAEDANYMNVSNNILALVKDNKVVSCAVRHNKDKNGWKPLTMSKVTRTSSIHSLNHLNRARSTIMG